MDGRCETCKWWRPAAEESQYSGVFGACTRFPQFALIENHGGGDPFPDKGAFTPGDLWTSHGWLVTRPDFGCVQHEPKDSDA